ncbi:hypothetical protein HUA78_07475 [Myxococcus sp. CA033]|uniref:hypothetical protein n=2 Tax=Myxococcaceae TaxID=31 RepID=UPI00157AA854|nr:hypothetical protein [Myxococcus sp. CA033]NTX34273.1 hypothetical protein [Myxococcus sp. CA033]
MSTHGHGKGPRLIAGEPLSEEGSPYETSLGGWFRLRESGDPVLLTVEHRLGPPVLPPAPGGLTMGGGLVPQPPPYSRGEDGIVDRRPEGRWLRHVITQTRVAQVMATEARQWSPSGLLDACIAAPLDPAERGTGEYPPVSWVPRVAAPRVGSTVMKYSSRGGLHRGRIISVGEDGQEVLVTATDDRHFSVAGEPGALLIDLEARAAVALYLGDVYMRGVNERQWAVLWSARPLPLLMEAFRLAPF